MDYKEFTRETLISMIGEKKKVESDLHKKYMDAGTEINNMLDAVKDTYAIQYADKIGKKVRIVCNGPTKSWRSNMTIEGFLKGFDAKRIKWDENVLSSIKPVVAKTKKDGTESKNVYTFYDTPSFAEITDIVEI